MAELPKLTCVVTLSGGVDFTVVRGEGGDLAVYTVTLGDGDYFILGDGTADDLLREIEDEVIAQAPSMGSFAATLDTITGLVGLGMTVIGQTATLDFAGGSSSTNALFIQALFRYPSPPTTVALSIVNSLGSRTHDGGFYPCRAEIDDMQRKAADSSQTRTDAGQVTTAFYFTHIEHRLSILADANPEALVANEYHAWDALSVNCLQQGKRFRYYRDKTITTVFAEITNPLGFFTLVAIKETVMFDPLAKLLSRGWYQHFAFDFECFAYVA